MERRKASGPAPLHLEPCFAPDAGDYRYQFGSVLAAKGNLVDALTQFEQSSKLSRTQKPEILEMLAPMYSENGRYAGAIASARCAPELANQEQDQSLAASLQANRQHDEAQVRNTEAKQTFWYRLRLLTAEWCRERYRKRLHPSEPRAQPINNQ